MKGKGKGIREKVSPVVQCVYICATAIILIVCFTVRINYFRTVDDPERHKLITPKKLRSFGGYSEFINVGLEVTRFDTF